MRQETYNRLMVVGMVVVFLISVFTALQVAAPEYQEMSLTGIGMLVDGANTDQFVVDQTGTGDIVEFRDNGTVVWRLSDGGGIWHNGAMDLNGNELTLDADADTSITADTDDQVDFELAGVDTVMMLPFPTSATTTATTKILEVYGSTPAWTANTNYVYGINVDLAVGDANTGTHTIAGVVIDGISQDAQATETGLIIGNGWDRGIDLDGNALYMDNDQDSYFSELADDSIGFTPGAATGSLEVRSGNLQVGDGTPDETHNGEDFYCEGISEFDGAAYFDGAVDFDAGLVGAEDVENTMLPTIVSTAITYTAAAGGSGTVATIADGEIWFVHKIFVRTTTSFACTDDDCYLHIGDGNDTDGFLALADASIQSDFTEATGFAAGWAGIENGSAGAYTTDDGGPFVYAPSGSAETIDWLLDETSGESYSAGAATIYVIYTRIQ